MSDRPLRETLIAIYQALRPGRLPSKEFLDDQEELVRGAMQAGVEDWDAILAFKEKWQTDE